ncbi:MAG: hypothetical protein DMF04_10790 [Verrucomicrobia bacterium]|nr:MAG: hypothetical protein DMF04_10790 [Verrucomicrobiota bacterium]
MENVGTHEDWKVCFSELAPGLVLFARQWVKSAADAEDVVQEAFVRFWRRNLSINNRRTWLRSLFGKLDDSCARSVARRSRPRFSRTMSYFKTARAYFWGRLL